MACFCLKMVSNRMHQHNKFFWNSKQYKKPKKNHLKIEKKFLKEKDVINLYRKNWNYKIEFKLQQFIMKKCAFRMRKGKWEIFALKQLSNVCTNCNQILNIFKILIPHFMKVGGSSCLLQNGMDDSPICGNEFPVSKNIYK